MHTIIENIKNFFNRFTKKEKKNFLILGAVILLILLGLVAVSQRQLIKKRAAGSGQIDLRLVPGPGSNIALSQSTTAKIRLYNTSSFLSLTLSGAQATFTVTNLSVNAALVRCLDPFRGIGYKSVVGDTVTIMCGVPPDPLTQIPPTVPAGSSIDFAEVEFTPVTTGNATVTFNTTRVTGIGQAGSGSSPDFSTAGQNANYTVVTALPSTTPVPTLVGLPPACDGGIAIDNINFVNGKFQVIAGTTVKLMAYGISDPDGIVSNVNFRFKSVNDLTCPSSGDGSLIQGQVIHTTDINAVDVWTIMWDTSGVPTGDYNVWASPVDNIGNSCSGNPAANGGNNYCGTNGLCVNCKTVANLSVLASGTPIPPTPTTQPNPTITLPPGTGAIEGWVFIDTNQNGIHQHWSPFNENQGITGVTINLRYNGQLARITQTVGGALGAWYGFTNLPAGAFTVEEVQPSGYISTSPNTLSINLTSGQRSIDNNFGEFPQAITSTPTPTAAPTNTPLPTGASPQPTPTTQPGCTRKSEGDANCDGKIDLIDFSLWVHSQCAVIGASCGDLTADFDGDGDVDYHDDTNGANTGDYEIWVLNRYT